MEMMILIAQTASVGFLTLWLTTGVLENIFHPMVNETYTAEVMRMHHMREEYPEQYVHVAYRRIESRRLQLLAFRLIVFWEALATIALWVGLVAMAMALFGAAEVETARTLALFGALMFTATWAMFLIGGNYFCYWFGHEGGQNTHYQMTLWGMLTMILMVVG